MCENVVGGGQRKKYIMKVNVPFTVLYLVIMITAVVSLDVAFFQGHAEWRLFGNIASVAFFLAGYLLLSRLFQKKK